MTTLTTQHSIYNQFGLITKISLNQDLEDFLKGEVGHVGTWVQEQYFVKLEYFKSIGYEIGPRTIGDAIRREAVRLLTKLYPV